MTRFLIVFLSFFIFFATGVGAADRVKKNQDITTEHTMVLGDNDSRNDARYLCYLEAEKKLLDKLHFLLIMEGYGDDHWFDREDVDIYAGYLIDIEAGEEKWTYRDGTLSLTLSINTMINPDHIGKRLKEVRSDDNLMDTMKKDYAALRQQKENYRAVYASLSDTGKVSPLGLRKKRRAIAEEIDRLEKITFAITVTSKTAEEKISPGMTLGEVISLAGQPRSVVTCQSPCFLNYGEKWVVLRDGIVVGLVPLEQWKGACGDYGAQAETGVGGEGVKDESAAGLPTLEEDKFIIILKSGQTVTTSAYYQIDDVIYYKQSGGIVGMEASKVERIDPQE